MKQVIQGLVILIIAFGFPLALLWVYWKAWCFVLPLIYQSGPINLIHPNFWLFFVVWFLVGAIGRTLFCITK